MTYVNVEIVRFIDNHFPGFVECQLTDVHARCWIIHEKYPVVNATDEWLDENTAYPVPGVVGCHVLERNGGVARIDTDKPWHIASVEGNTIFEVSESLISEDDRILDYQSL